jgi:hypothetical protein
VNFVAVSLFDRDGATLTGVGLLPNILSARWLDELEDAGSFEFRIPVEDGETIEVGHIVKFSFGPTSASYVFAGVVERIQVEEVSRSTDSVTRILAVSGRGVRALLEDAIVYNSGASNVRTFTAATAGEIMKTLLDEAQTRGALTGLTYGFNNANDSNGDPFVETITMDVQVGTTLLQLAAEHQELAVDCWLDPNLLLYYVNERGTDRTTGGNPLVLRVGQSVGQVTKQVAGPVRNTLLVATGQDGTTFTTEEDAGSQATYGRREAYLALANTTDTTFVTLSTSKLLTTSAAPADGITIQLDDLGPLPYLDFELGDLLYLAGVDGTRTTYRVRGISIDLNEDGSVSFVPELGTVRADLTRRLQRALSRIESATASGESAVATSGGISGLGGGGGGGVELVNGEVLTYNDNTETGTVDIDGTTYNFDNATGFSVAPGDLITLTDVVGITDKVAVAVYDRVGSYTPTVLNNPQAVSGFPFDGDQLPDPFNYAFSDNVSIGSAVTPANYPACAVAWYGSGVLGYAGRVVVFLERGGTLAQPTIVFYDVETGSSTAVNRTAAVGATNVTTNIGVVGTRLFVTYDGTTGNCVESYNSSTGVWSTHDIQSAVFLGVSDSRAWWVGKVSGAANPTRWKVVSLDSSGTLSSIDNPANVTAGTQVFGRAKNGKLFFRINTAGALLYVANTNVAAASLTFTSATAPATLPYSSTGSAGTVAIRDGNRAHAYSDIDTDGWCYYFVRTGTPTTAGFAKIDPTTLAVTTYTQLTSSTGNAADGELLLAGGLCLAGTTVVLFGAVREDKVTGGTRTGSCVPAYWRTDGTTTTRTDDTEYVGLLGSSSGATEGFARTTVVHRDNVTSTFYFHTNLAALGTLGGAPSGVKATGPAYGEAFTV